MIYQAEEKKQALQAVWQLANDLEEAIQLAERYLAYVHADTAEKQAKPTI